LNLPSLGFDNCFGACALTRTFTDMVGGGSWAITSSLPAGVTMTPSAASFTVGNAASQAITFNFNVRNAPSLAGKWVYGYVTLTDTTGNNRPALKLPIALFSSPGNLPTQFSPAADVNLERGFFDVALSGIVALPNARFVTTDLVVPVASSSTVRRDNDSNVFNPCSTAATPCNYDTTVTIPASPSGGPVKYRVSTMTSSTVASADFDLYMGVDSNANGPEAAELGCTSGGATSDEACSLSIMTTAAPQTVWIRVNRYNGDTAAVAGAAVSIDTTSIALVAGTARSLVATGAGHPAESAAFTLRLGYDDPTFLPGQRRVGAVLVQAAPGSTIAEVPVVLKRSATAGFAPYTLAPGIARSVTLAAGAAHDKLFFTVPPNATSATFTTTGTGTVRLDVYRIANPAGPVIAASPTTGANGSSAVAGANQTVTLTGGPLLRQADQYRRRYGDR
jgi:hypothetical protein